MKITELFLDSTENAAIPTQFVVGEEAGNYGRVISIDFKGITHGTLGHTGMPTYIVNFNSGVRIGVPYERMAQTTVDTGKRVNDEDVGATPDLLE